MFERGAAVYCLVFSDKALVERLDAVDSQACSYRSGEARMNFARTCHQVFSTMVAKRRVSRQFSPAEDLFLATAHQRLEESARMLSALRRAASDPQTKPKHVLSLDGHRVSRYTGARIALVSSHSSSQDQATNDVTHAA
jgi:hypothetical protein